MLTRTLDADQLTLHEGTRRLLTLRPVRSRPAQQEGPARLVLSRFALVRRENGATLLESPRASHVAEVHDGAVLALLARPCARDEVSEWEWELAVQLHACGLLVAENSAEDNDFDLLAWRPHELWFHERSRGGEPSGATYWAKDRFPPLPARPRPSGAVTALSTPDMAEVAKRDPKLTDVLEHRRSVRRHGAEAMSADQLAEFLYRTARTRRCWWQDGEEYVDRPYPSGGSLHELELYPVVTRVEGVAPGLYHYDGHAHRLELVRAPGPQVDGLLRHAEAAAVMSDPPHVLFVITARFGRLMWKYRSMAYALTLKDTGVLFASMYQVATAMGLAPCALGGGDAELFAEATGEDPLVESSVGEFLLGSRDK